MVSVLQHRTDDSWSTSNFQDSPLGCNSVSWAPYTAISSQDENGMPLKRLVTGACDNKVRIWQSVDCVNWKEETKQQDVHLDWVRDVAWAPSSGMPCNMIASGSEDGTVYVWTQTEANRAWTPQLVNNFKAPVWRVSWSVTGNVLAVSSGDHLVTLWKQSLHGEWDQISSINESGALSQETKS